MTTVIAVSTVLGIIAFVFALAPVRYDIKHNIGRSWRGLLMRTGAITCLALLAVLPGSALLGAASSITMDVAWVIYVSTTVGAMVVVATLIGFVIEAIWLCIRAHKIKKLSAIGMEVASGNVGIDNELASAISSNLAALKDPTESGAAVACLTALADITEMRAGVIENADEVTATTLNLFAHDLRVASRIVKNVAAENPARPATLSKIVNEAIIDTH